MLTIGFQSPQLDVRGSCDAIYNYAHYNEVLLGNHSIILVPSGAKNEEEGLTRFRKRFFIDTYIDLDDAIEKNKINILYTIKFGKNDKVLTTKCPTIVHCVFSMLEPHGDVYMAVSQTLAKKWRKNEYLPHIVNQRPALNGNLREDLGIPPEAIVIGRHGGMDTFNLVFVRRTIRKIVKERDDIFFLFMNTPVFGFDKHIIYLPKTGDIDYKNKFISTCDAGLEASNMGHTFGLSCAEMSVNNKPMIVYNGPIGNRAHIDILGNKALYFATEEEFYKVVTTFEKKDRGDLNAYKEFTPEKVMEDFNRLCILPFKNKDNF